MNVYGLSMKTFFSTQNFWWLPKNIRLCIGIFWPYKWIHYKVEEKPLLLAPLTTTDEIKLKCMQFHTSLCQIEDDACDWELRACTSLYSLFWKSILFGMIYVSALRCNDWWVFERQFFYLRVVPSCELVSFCAKKDPMRNNKEWSNYAVPYLCV